MPSPRRFLAHATFKAAILLSSAIVASGHAIAAQFPIVVDNSADRLLQDLSIPPNAATAGMWSRVVNWPLVGIHISLLPTGQILTYGGNGYNGGTQDGRTFDVWDPTYGLTASAHIQMPDAQNVDSFCGTGALLPNGQQLLSGGSSYSDNDSPQASSTVTPGNLAVAGVAATLNAPRWYASMTTLPDGRNMISGGGIAYADGHTNPDTDAANGHISMTPEIYTLANGWKTMANATDRYAFGPDDNRWWYPRQWVMPNGTVFGISATNLWTLDPNAAAGNGTVTHWGAFKPTYSNTSLPNIGPTSTASMYRPGKIIQMGGNGRYNNDAFTSSAAATIFDLTGGGAPATRDVASMNYARQWANSVMLPNGKVLVTGGTGYGDDGTKGVYATETWDPATEKWTVGASAAVYRSYHSSTSLLPDGAILSTGGGDPGPYTNLNAEIYYPPYLFTQLGNNSTLAYRPMIVSLSTNKLANGDTLKVEMSDGGAIAQVNLMRLGLTTHSFNSAQAYVPATFTQNGNILSVAIPPSSATATPGYYQVVALNNAGTPTRGAIVAISAAFAAPPAAPALITKVQAPLTSLNRKAMKVAVGADGSAAYLDPNYNIYHQTAANAAWTLIPNWQAKDIAVVNQNSIWVIGLDNNVYHWQGAGWTKVGIDAASIAASSDGAIIVANLYDRRVWVKTADDNTNTWQNLPYYSAKRVAVSTKGTYWIIGLDDNVYHYTGGNGWAQVGTRASAISGSSDGGVVVLNEDDGSVQGRIHPNNDQDTTYFQPGGAGNEVAWRGTNGYLLIDAAGNLATR